MYCSFCRRQKKLCVLTIGDHGLVACEYCYSVMLEMIDLNPDLRAYQVELISKNGKPREFTEAVKEAERIIMSSPENLTEH